ncbi:hypothetical protein BC89_27890 [Pseudomonas monteilii]|nr:hypothetical protein BC89_27890 [Pseudomonas monteilii]MBA6112148.1 hypothetical protein [Pseudomonas asiatica]
MTTLFFIKVIQRFFVFLDVILDASGIGFCLSVVVEEFVIKQVIMFGFVQVIFVAHADSWAGGRPV